MLSMPAEVKISQSFGQNARFVITRSGVLLLILTLLTTLIEQYLTSVIHEQLMSREGVGLGLWISIFISFLISLFYPVLATLLVLASFHSTSIFLTVRKNLEQLLIENMRAIGQAFTWSLLFILPGIIRFIQLSFVNLIVLLDHKYQAGEIDALKRSVQLVNSRFFRVFGLFLLMAVVVPLFMSAFDEYSVLTQTPVSGFLLVVLEVLLFILLNLLLIKQWERANGTHV